jgi:hypothetical protein
MQERFAVVMATIIEYMLPLVIAKNTSSLYGDSDEYDGGPPSPKTTDATELEIDESLQNFIEELPFLEPFIMDLSFKGPIKVHLVFVLLQKVSLLGE